jgi:hypothetical protein
MWLLAQTMPKAMWIFAIRVGGTWSIFIEGVAFYFSSPDNAYDPDVNALINKIQMQFLWNFDTTSQIMIHKLQVMFTIDDGFFSDNLYDS